MACKNHFRNNKYCMNPELRKICGCFVCNVNVNPVKLEKLEIEKMSDILSCTGMNRKVEKVSILV